MNSYRQKCVIKRNCNPLNPVYRVPQLGGQTPIEIGPIDRNIPKRAITNIATSKGTRTNDIQGAMPHRWGVVFQSAADELR